MKFNLGRGGGLIYLSSPGKGGRVIWEGGVIEDLRYLTAIGFSLGISVSSTGKVQSTVFRSSPVYSCYSSRVKKYRVLPKYWSQLTQTLSDVTGSDGDQVQATSSTGLGSQKLLVRYRKTNIQIPANHVACQIFYRGVTLCCSDLNYRNWSNWRHLLSKEHNRGTVWSTERMTAQVLN